MIELIHESLLVALPQALQFLLPIPVLYYHKKKWFHTNSAKALFIIGMLGASLLSRRFYPYVEMWMYPLFAIGFILTTKNLPITILLTCFLAEVHELPAHLLLRSNINFMGALGNLIHAITVLSWMFFVLYSALKLGRIETDGSFTAIFISALILNSFIYFVNPSVDVPPTSFLFIFKRLIWFTALIIIFIRYIKF